MEILKGWVKPEGNAFIKSKDNVFAWPENLINDIASLIKILRVVYPGTLVGQLIRDILVPAHALALSAEEIVRTVGGLVLRRVQDKKREAEIFVDLPAGPAKGGGERLLRSSHFL